MITVVVWYSPTSLLYLQKQSTDSSSKSHRPPDSVSAGVENHQQSRSTIEGTRTHTEHPNTHRAMTLPINTDGCVLHPKRVSLSASLDYPPQELTYQRRIRHIRGLSLYNLALKHTPHHDDTVEHSLQTLNKDCFLDVFYSLHFSTGEPFYVSEVREQVIDVEFQEFQLCNLKRSDESDFTVKIWVRREDNWNLHMNLSINLRGLIYCDEPLGTNCVMIDLSDGRYLLPTNGFDLKWYEQHIKHSTTQRIMTSLTYDTLMKLNGLVLSIEDLTISKMKIAQQITVQKDTKQAYREHQLQIMISAEQEKLDIKEEKLTQLKIARQQKLKRLAQLKSKHQLQLAHLANNKEDFSQVLIQHEDTLNDLTMMRAKAIKTILTIFPTKDIAQWLQIPQFDLLPHDIPLTRIDSLRHMEMNAAFGQLVHMTMMLSNYLAVPLRYKLRFYGSYSMVIDNVSQIQQRKVFPLFYTQHFHRLQYGVLLLITDMNDIMEDRYKY